MSVTNGCERRELNEFTLVNHSMSQSQAKGLPAKKNSVRARLLDDDDDWDAVDDDPLSLSAFSSKWVNALLFNSTFLKFLNALNVSVPTVLI